MCKVSAVGRISDCQIGDPRFISRPGPGLNSVATSFRHTVRGQGR